MAFASPGDSKNDIGQEELSVAGERLARRVSPAFPNVLSFQFSSKSFTGYSKRAAHNIYPPAYPDMQSLNHETYT